MPGMSRLLGIDYGRKRIGVAVAHTETRIATPLETLAGQGDATRDARRVADFGESQEVSAFVVGLPLNMADGSDSEQTAITRKFAAELGRLSGKPVHLHDERLSSFAAGEALDEAGVKPRRQKGLTDRVAAQKILQAYLDQAG
jgi:putative Holliday junction resolvase